MADSSASNAYNTNGPFESLSEGFPNALITDMSLTVAESITVSLTAIRITDAFAFLSFENATTKTGVGHVMVIRPEPFRVYTIESTGYDCRGWLVFGPSVKTFRGEFRDTDMVVRDSCLLIAEAPASGITTLSVNGLEDSLTGVLELAAKSNFISVTKATRDFIIDGDTISADCFLFQRATNNIPENILYTGFLDLGADVYAEYPTVYTINGVPPDAAGNIDIQTQNYTWLQCAGKVNTTFWETPITLTRVGGTDPVGLMISTNNAHCVAYNPETTIKHGRCELGMNVSLPLDDLISTRHDNPACDPWFPPSPPFDEDCGCTPPSGSGTGITWPTSLDLNVQLYDGDIGTDYGPLLLDSTSEGDTVAVYKVGLTTILRFRFTAGITPYWKATLALSGVVECSVELLGAADEGPVGIYLLNPVDCFAFVVTIPVP